MQLRDRIVRCMKDRADRLNEIEMLKKELSHRIEHSLRQGWLGIFGLDGNSKTPGVNAHNG